MQIVYRHFLFRTFLFWMILFAFMRILFVILNYKFLEGGFGHKLILFFAALRLDASMAAYLMVPVFIVWMAYGIFQKKLMLTVARYINIVLAVPVVLICLTNIGNYPNWQTVINKRVLLYFENPAEVTHFMSTMQLVMTPLLIILFSWLALWFHKKFVKREHAAPIGWKTLSLHLFVLPVLVIFIRGGLQQTPITESTVYYSNYNGNNHAAVNPVYYFGHSVSEYFYVTKKYQFFEEKRMNGLVTELMAETSTDSLPLTSVEKPNLVIILLESWTADVLESLGGEKGVTPYTEELIKESLLFTQCYGSGYRTDQGLVAVLAGYPSQPDNSIIAYPAKTQELPSLCEFLKTKKYNTSFFYGGDISFANMKSFIVQQGFEFISDKENYDPKDYNSKWGAHDGKVLDSQIEYLNKSSEPFFSGLLTLSTHEPFEVPIKHKFPHNSDPNKFKNSAYYTDQCLKDFFAKVKKTDWYENTLFLLIADHGHYLPRIRSMNKPESKRIACIITGGALTKDWKGKKWNHPVNQHDMIRLIAPYVGFDEKKFPFAKNPFRALHPFAYYANENVMGFVNDTTHIIYEIPKNNMSGDLRVGDFARAYLQWTYQDFVSR